MAMPVEHEEVVPNRAFTRSIIAHWPDGHGPLHHGEDFLPIDGCLLIQRRLEEQIRTGHMFSLMINASWRAESDDWATKFHVQSRKFNVSPATVGGEEYNYANVLRAIKEAYANEMMERTNEGSRVHLEELTELLARENGKVLNEAMGDVLKEMHTTLQQAVAEPAEAPAVHEVAVVEHKPLTPEHKPSMLSTEIIQALVPMLQVQRKSVPQFALNWKLQAATIFPALAQAVSQQLKKEISAGAVEFAFHEFSKLDEASGLILF